MYCSRKAEIDHKKVYKNIKINIKSILIFKLNIKLTNGNEKNTKKLEIIITEK